MKIAEFYKIQIESLAKQMTDQFVTVMERSLECFEDQTATPIRQTPYAAFIANDDSGIPAIRLECPATGLHDFCSFEDFIDATSLGPYESTVAGIDNLISRLQSLRAEMEGESASE